MIEIFNENVKRKLENIAFVEAASTNVETQNALLESLETENVEGRFSSAESMFSHMVKEWEQE